VILSVSSTQGMSDLGECHDYTFSVTECCIALNHLCHMKTSLCKQYSPYVLVISLKAGATFKSTNTS